jgi:GDPmannose 4,6-dehydratase
MWQMLQQDQPEDLVLATGQTTTVRAFCEMAYAHLGIKLKWKGQGVNEKGILHGFNAKQFEEVTNLSASDFQLSTDEVLIEVDPQYFRPTEVEILLGDPARAKEKLGCQAEYSDEELAKDMIEKDFKRIKD